MKLKRETPVQLLHDFIESQLTEVETRINQLLEKSDKVNTKLGKHAKEYINLSKDLDLSKMAAKRALLHLNDIRDKLKKPYPEQAIVDTILMMDNYRMALLDSPEIHIPILNKTMQQKICKVVGDERSDKHEPYRKLAREMAKKGKLEGKKRRDVINDIRAIILEQYCHPKSERFVSDAISGIFPPRKKAKLK